MRYLKTYEQLNYGTSIDIGGVIVYPFHTIGNLVNIPGETLDQDSYGVYCAKSPDPNDDEPPIFTEEEMEIIESTLPMEIKWKSLNVPNTQKNELIIIINKELYNEFVSMSKFLTEDDLYKNIIEYIESMMEDIF